MGPWAFLKVGYCHIWWQYCSLIGMLTALFTCMLAGSIRFFGYVIAPSVWWVLPFGGMLLSIALGPLVGSLLAILVFYLVLYFIIHIIYRCLITLSKLYSFLVLTISQS